MFIPPKALVELVDYRYPDALWVEFDGHSTDCFTVWVLDLDESYNVWRCHLSLDGRWSLSPVDIKWDDDGNVTSPRRLQIDF
jgi:hypothetical protein